MKLSVHKSIFPYLYVVTRIHSNLNLMINMMAELRGCYIKGKQDCPPTSVPVGAYREVSLAPSQAVKKTQKLNT